MKSFKDQDVIKLLRQHQGSSRTQAEFARLIGVSQQYLCDVYAGRRSPGPAILKFLGLAKAYIKEVATTIRSESGQAIAEAALLLPVFVLVSFMLIDIQWMTKDAAAIEYIVTESARCEAIQSGACTNASQTRTYATNLGTNMHLSTGSGFDLTTPNCTRDTCTVSLSYHYKPLGAYFPALTISRTGTAAVAPAP